MSNSHPSKKIKFGITRIFLICPTFACLIGCKGQKSATQKPNIILIMADDLGYGGIGSYRESRINS